MLVRQRCDDRRLHALVVDQNVVGFDGGSDVGAIEGSSIGHSVPISCANPNLRMKV